MDQTNGRARAFFLLAVLTALPAVAAEPTTQTVGQPAEMPVKSVTLFSSGVGYFEHAGVVTDDGSTQLRFKTEQINDILKSLVLQDLDGGHVSAVQYASQDPVDKTLKSFQVDLTGNPPMADVLNQLRGAKVTLDVAGEQQHGMILGVENRETVAVPPAPPVDS